MASSSSSQGSGADVFDKLGEAIRAGDVGNMMSSFHGAYHSDESGFNQKFRKFVHDFYGEDNMQQFHEIMAKFGRTRGKGGITALHASATHGFTSTLKHLIENAGYDVDMENDKGATALHYAVRENNVEIAAYLIEKGANINKCDEQGLTPLHAATVNGHIESMQLLLSKNADVDYDAGLEMGTPLHCAVSANGAAAMLLLLENGANPNYSLGGVLTPLYLSIICASAECVKLLLEAGANPNICACGMSPLGHAATLGETEIVQYLLKAGANPNHRDEFGYTPFENAVYHSRLKCTMVLFNFTSPLSSFADWNLFAILELPSSEVYKAKRDLIMKEGFRKMKSEGDNAFRRKEYMHAMCWYTQAMHKCPSDASVRSDRSLCWVHLKHGSNALSDAQACVGLRPDWSKAHYREGVAWKMQQNYPKAIEAFQRALNLNPNNKQIQAALQSAVEEQANQKPSGGQFPF